MYREIHFPGQREDEVVILFLRRHWFIFFLRLVTIIIAIAGLVFVYFLFNSLNTNFTESAFHNLLVFIESLGTLFIWNFFFILWLDFYLDAWIVTNERIINISQRGFFSRDISELKLTKIQDVTSEIIGIFPTLLNYGDILVQTAGKEERFNFCEIPNPNHVKNVIVQLQEKERRHEEQEFGRVIRSNP